MSDEQFKTNWEKAAGNDANGQVRDVHVYILYIHIMYTHVYIHCCRLVSSHSDKC